MQKIKAFAIRHPIVSGFLVILIFALLGTLTWPITQIYTRPEGHEVGTALSKIVISGCFLLVLWRFGWVRTAGFATPGFRNVWLVVIAAAVYKMLLGVYAFTGSLRMSLPAGGLTLAVIFFTFTTSLVEETMYRGLLLTIMEKAWGNSRRGLYAAAAISGLFWGSTHLFNLIVDPFPVVALQALETALSGLLYAAFVLYSGSIWPAVFMHWVLNASISLQIEQIADYQVPPEAWSTLTLVGMPLLLVAVYLLRRSKPEIESAGETAAVMPAS